MSRDSAKPRDGRGIADESAAAAAARVVGTRLRAVHELLRAVAGGDVSEDAVHDLRVATRRARAALDGFEPILPARQVEWFRARLTRLRRAAGKVRDLDGILAGLRSIDPRGARPKGGADVARAIEIVAGKRAGAQEALARAVERFPGSKRWKAHVRKLLDAIDRRGTAPSFDHLATARLRGIVGKFFAAVAAAGDDVDALHALRIRAKRARYAIEGLAPMPSPARRRALSAFEKLQDLAGRCIDQATAAARFARWGKRAAERADRKTFASLAATSEEAAEAARRRALAWLTPRLLGDLRRDVARLPDGRSPESFKARRPTSGSRRR